MNDSGAKPLLDRSAGGVWLERQRQEIQRLRIVTTPDIRAKHSERGTELYFQEQPGGGGGGSGSAVRQFRLKDWSYADFLIGREITANSDWDPIEDTNRFTESEVDTIIAKPFWLRRTEFDELTITVVVETLVSGNIVETDTFWRFTYHSANLRVVEQLQSVGGTVLSTETEIVLPRYVEDEIIYASEVDDLQMQAFEENILLLQDREIRQWAHQFV